MQITITFLPLAGRVMFRGTDGEGDSCDYQVSMDTAYAWHRSLTAAIAGAEAPWRGMDAFGESMR